MLQARKPGEDPLARGARFMKERKYASAISEFRKVLRKQPKHFKALRYLGFCHAQENRLSEAIKAYTAVLDINPNDCAARNHLGLLYAKQGEVERAIDELNRALAVNEQRTFDYLTLGRSLIEDGFLEKAITVLRKASKLRLQHACICYRLEWIYYDHHLLELALAHWRETLEVSGVGNGRISPTGKGPHGNI